MSGLWGRRMFTGATNAGRARQTSPCLLCTMPVVHYTPRSEPMHAPCAGLCVQARFELERNGALPRHGRKLDGVFSAPEVLARARELRLKESA